MKILLSLALLFCFVAILPAQERVIDRLEFEKMVAQGHTHKLKWKGEKYRMTVTTSSKAIGRPQTDYSSNMISEYGSSTETRNTSTSTFGPNPPSTWEALRIGNWLYTRSGNKPWTRKEYAAPTSAEEKEAIPYQILSSQAEYRYLGEGKLIDRPVQIFAKTERQTKVNQKTGETSETVSKNKYWVDPTGLVRKSEFVAETRGKNTTQTSVIMEWQLDPSISLTPPVIEP